MRTTLHIAAFAALLVSPAAAIAQPAEYPGAPVSTTVFVTFPHGGTVFRPPAESLGTLASAKDAAMITIRGRTSTLTPTAKDEALAVTFRNRCDVLEITATTGREVAKSTASC